MKQAQLYLHRITGGTFPLSELTTAHTPTEDEWAILLAQDRYFYHLLEAFLDSQGSYTLHHTMALSSALQLVTGATMFTQVCLSSILGLFRVNSGHY